MNLLWRLFLRGHLCSQCEQQGKHKKTFTSYHWNPLTEAQSYKEPLQWHEHTHSDDLYLDNSFTSLQPQWVLLLNYSTALTVMLTINKYEGIASFCFVSQRINISAVCFRLDLCLRLWVSNCGGPAGWRSQCCAPTCLDWCLMEEEPWGPFLSFSSYYVCCYAPAYKDKSLVCEKLISNKSDSDSDDCPESLIVRVWWRSAAVETQNLFDRKRQHRVVWAQLRWKSWGLLILCSVGVKPEIKQWIIVYCLLSSRQNEKDLCISVETEYFDCNILSCVCKGMLNVWIENDS